MPAKPEAESSNLSEAQRIFLGLRDCLRSNLNSTDNNGNKNNDNNNNNNNRSINDETFESPEHDRCDGDETRFHSRDFDSSGQLSSAEKLPPRRPAPSLPGAPFVPPTHLPIHHQPTSPQTITLPIEDHDKLVNENKILQSENSQMRQLLDSKQSDDNKMQLMRKEITTSKQQILELKTELHVANMERTKFGKTIESMNDELNQMRQQHAKMQEFCEQLSPTLDEDRRKIEELETLNHNLKGDNESFKGENRDLREELTRKNTQLDKLKDDCSAHERRIALYENRCKCGGEALNESDLTQSRLDEMGVGGLNSGHPLRQQPGVFGPGGANMGGLLSPPGAQFNHRHANSSAGNSDKSGSSGGAGDLLGPVTSTTTTTTANTNLSSSHHLISPTDHRPRHLNHSHHEDQTESEELLHSESLEPEEWQRLKQQRRSIAHPPRRTQNLVAQLDPLVALANQKSASAEDLTLEKRNKKSLQYPNGQSHGKLFQKNKSTSQSLTKMSMQNKFYSQRYHGGSKYSQSQHSSSKSSLGLTSGLYEEVPGESAETKAELQALNDTHPNEWNMHMVELFFKHHLKWSDSQSVQAAEKIKSGRSLVDLSASTVKKFLGIEDEYQIKRLLVYIQIVRNDPMMPQDIASYPGLRRMDHLWVANTFLPHLGLQNLSEHFKTNLVDMVLLKTLNEKEIERLCAKVVPNPKMAAGSIEFGLKMLKELDFSKQDFKRRRMQPQQKLMHLANERKSKLTAAGSSSDPDHHNTLRMDRENVGDLLVWSNETLMNWAKALDFDDQTVGKLKLSGINGSFIAYSMKFSAKELAVAMGMNNTDPENPMFKHLKENFDNLVENPRKQIREKKKKKKTGKQQQQSYTLSSAEGQRILQDQQQQASFRRSFSVSS
ncbi:uncharacterized protein LOC142358161 isoform X2 [Convolutriloba macropyga]|uniref:uncharacterized protein LOC142358161 isoform X2 n=1 Tax=Convolutriloba macropyga TaxID=536237 RepID=UPI003F5238A4